MFITVYSLLQSEFSSEASDIKFTARSLSIRCELAASAPPLSRSALFVHVFTVRAIACARLSLANRDVKSGSIFTVDNRDIPTVGLDNCSNDCQSESGS